MFELWENNLLLTVNMGMRACSQIPESVGCQGCFRYQDDREKDIVFSTYS